MKIKKKWFKIVFCLIVVAVCFLSAGAIGCSNGQIYAYNTIFNQEFGTDYVSGAERLYFVNHAPREGGFYLDIWEFKEAPEELLRTAGFYTSRYAESEGEEKEKMKADIQSDFEKSVTCCDYSVESIPQEYRPDWNKEFLCSGRRIYFRDTNIMIVWKYHH